jgi:signal transduction histidine kinase
MGKEMIEKIFSIGQNVSRTGTENEPSTGLGLLLCEEFIVKHNGKIWVESEVGIGSTFYFAIPTNTENKGKLD